MDKSSELDCYLFYMWNAWNKEECMALFGDNGSAIWRVWEKNLEEYKNPGAPSAFYCDIRRVDRKTLAGRAVKYYNE